MGVYTQVLYPKNDTKMNFSEVKSNKLQNCIQEKKIALMRFYYQKGNVIALHGFACMFCYSVYNVADNIV